MTAPVKPNYLRSQSSYMRTAFNAELVCVQAKILFRDYDCFDVDFVKSSLSWTGELDLLLRQREVILETKANDFDTIVGTGLSGCLVLAQLAKVLDVEYLAVRKSNDSSHSEKTCEGSLGKSWLFVDDFIGTGATFYRVKSAVETLCASPEDYYADYGHEPMHVTKFAGIYTYQDRRFISPDKCGRKYW